MPALRSRPFLPLEQIAAPSLFESTDPDAVAVGIFQGRSVLVDAAGQILTTDPATVREWVLATPEGQRLARRAARTIEERAAAIARGLA